MLVIVRRVREEVLIGSGMTVRVESINYRSRWCELVVSNGHKVITRRLVEGQYLALREGVGVKLTRIDGRFQVKLAFNAARHIPILRSELLAATTTVPSKAADASPTW